MPTKTKSVKSAPRKLKLARYIAVTGELAAALKAYQGLLKRMADGRKIDAKAFDEAVKAMNRAGDNWDRLTEKHEEAVLDYIDQSVVD